MDLVFAGHVAVTLAAVALDDPPMPDLHRALCELLAADGIEIGRSSLGLETLHPELGGSLLVWTSDGHLRQTWPRRAGIETSPSYLNSPTFLVDETGRPFRQRLDADELPAMPLLHELRDQGLTDYVLFPLPFADRQLRTATVSFATAHVGGFSPGQMAHLETAAALFGPYAEKRLLRTLAVDVLATYVGKEAAQRVFDGRIQRGDGEAIKAAILFADMRGFTSFSDRHPAADVIGTLNEWFGAVGDAVAARGGEILKFIGDGILAIFPVASDAPADACDRAYDAALDAANAVTALNATREEALGYGLALHVGTIVYGNIGTEQRLDFTAIGPAVNHACRLEELTKTVGQPILASPIFARLSTRPLVGIGHYALRGVEQGPVEIFAPAR